MGCGGSKHTLETVDDSVHVMLAHDKKMAKKHGEKVNTGYVPRAEHPLLKQMEQLQQEQQEQEQQDGAAAKKPVIVASE